MNWHPENLLKEVRYQAVRSSGPGGQNVNKVNTKVILEWDLEKSAQFSEDQKNRLRIKLENKLNKDGVFQLYSDATRSQLKNKEIVNKKFIELIKQALQKPKKRKQPKPGKKFHKKRLEQKNRQAEKKKNRQKPDV